MRGLVLERGDVCFGLGKFVVAHFPMISGVCGIQAEKCWGGGVILRGTEWGDNAEPWGDDHCHGQHAVRFSEYLFLVLF